MSRSYKKNAIIKDKNCKKAKKSANKKVRNTNNLSNGSNYKKAFCSYDICDYKINPTISFSEYIEIEKQYRDITNKTWKELYKDYYKNYLSK